MIGVAEIYQVALADGIPSRAIMVQDDTFRACEPSSLTQDLGSTIKQIFALLKITPDEVYDCNHVSGLAVAVAGLMAAQAKARAAVKLPGNPLIGTFAFERGAGGHSIDWAIHRDPQTKLYSVCYEPQANAIGEHMQPIEKPEGSKCVELRIAG